MLLSLQIPQTIEFSFTLILTSSESLHQRNSKGEMASSAVTGSLLKFLKVGPVIAMRNSPGSLRVLVTGAPGAPGSFEGADPQMMKDSAGMESAASESRGMASAAAQEAHETVDEADDMADQMAEKAHDMSRRAKQTAQDAWGSAKETAQKVKETVVGRAEDAKDFIKEKAQAVDGESCEKTAAAVKAANNPEDVKKAMNTKDC